MIGSPPLPATQQAVDELRDTPAAPLRYRQKPPLWHWVPLTGECDGGRVEVLLNPPLGLLASLQTTSGICARLHEMVRAWNLDDAEGAPLPITPAGVAQLDPAVSTAIMEAWGAEREKSKSRR